MGISISIPNLNFDFDEDEDWFTWSANDTWYDDPTIAITIEADDLLNLRVALYALRASDEGDVSALELLVEKSMTGTDYIIITEEDFPVEESSGGWFDWLVDSVTGWFDGSDDHFYLQRLGSMQTAGTPCMI